jgi:hypothetical protein
MQHCAAFAGCQERVVAVSGIRSSVPNAYLGAS